MKYCYKCGNELFDEAVICPKCGCAQENFTQRQTKDSNNIFWFIISFLWWWVGFILFFVWKETAPNKAKMCLKGSLTVLALAAVVGVIALFMTI